MPSRATEPANAKLARFEEILNSIREDVSEIKGTVHAFDRRVSMLEDVRVRALEDARIQQNAVAAERARAADAAQAAAERAAESASQRAGIRIGKKQLWIGSVGVGLLLAAVSVLSALISSGRI